MSNLASTYFALGRHADALAMDERVLEFDRRVLPADHPLIGEGCERRDGLHAMRLTARGLFWFDLTCRQGHGQSCFDVLCAWKALGCACDEGAGARVPASRAACERSFDR
jgi:hypothetical protein